MTPGACRVVVGLAALLAIAGCTRIAKITNLDASACTESLRVGLARTLENRGTLKAEAEDVASDVVGRRALARLGPRAFVVEAPDGTDYTFFVQKKNDACLLRLYGEQKGFWTYTNDLLYIDTQPLDGCSCAD